MIFEVENSKIIDITSLEKTQQNICIIVVAPWNKSNNFQMYIHNLTCHVSRS